MLIKRLTAITVLFAMFLVSSIPLRAQTSTDDWSRVNALESNTKVSIKLKTGKSIKGHVNSVSESGISLRGQTEVKREEIQAVYRVTSRSATKATLIGMGIGAGAGAITGGVGSRGDFDKLDQAVTGGLTILGAGIGAGTGYLIGRSGSKKELIYNAR